MSQWEKLSVEKPSSSDTAGYTGGFLDKYRLRRPGKEDNKQEKNKEKAK